MADKTILLRQRSLKQTSLATSLVILMAVFTGGGRDGNSSRFRQLGFFTGREVGNKCLRDDFGGNGMGGSAPRICLVANQTQFGTGVFHYQKFAILIVVRIMAGSALQPALRIHLHRLRAQMRGIINIRIRVKQAFVIHKGNWMIPAQIQAKISRDASRHDRHSAFHNDLRCPAADIAQCHLAIVAA